MKLSVIICAYNERDTILTVLERVRAMHLGDGWKGGHLYGAHLTDVATAARMVRTDVVRSLRLSGSGFDLDFELTDKLLRAGHRIVEVPISYRPRTIAEGKKIRPWDGLWALKVIIRDWLLPMKYVLAEQGTEGE